MNVTFLIGNGFDLACGMKTSYSDIYEEYIKSPSSTPVVEQFKQDLISEKTKENWGNWSDFEMGMAKFASNFSSEKDFISCIADFKKFLKQHLQKEQERFEKIWKQLTEVAMSAAQNYIDKFVFEFYLGVSKKIEKEIRAKRKTIIQNRFINFNYTKTLEILFENVSWPNRLYHIHGTLEDGDVTLGVDNETQIKNGFTLTKRGRRMFIKPFFNDDEDPQKVQEINTIIKTSECICAFGLSFGDSDLTWKNAVIEWLRSDPTHHLFLYDYNCSKIEIDDVAMKRNEEIDQKLVILAEKNFCKEEDPIFDQIHIPIGKTLFDLLSFMKKLINEHKKTA